MKSRLKILNAKSRNIAKLGVAVLFFVHKE